MVKNLNSLSLIMRKLRPGKVLPKTLRRSRDDTYYGLNYVPAKHMLKS